MAMFIVTVKDTMFIATVKYKQLEKRESIALAENNALQQSYKANIRMD